MKSIIFISFVLFSQKFEAAAAAAGAGAGGGGDKPSWEAGEQKGVDGAKEETLRELAAFNGKYEQRFGYIFLVCATGKTADEMLALLKARMGNDPALEVRGGPWVARLIVVNAPRCPA